MEKKYSIFLDNTKIGITEFEHGDAPMGVVYGKILPNEKIIDYQFILDYWKKNNLRLADHYSDIKFVSTTHTDKLIVKNKSGIEIIGDCNQISGTDEDGFEISISGIPYPFYEEEFPHHRKEYYERNFSK